jgi:hypothetical protein
VFGQATPAVTGDALTATLISDVDFGTAQPDVFTSSVAIGPDGTTSYTPGAITPVYAGSNAISYTVTDTAAGATTTKQQIVNFTPHAISTLSLPTIDASSGFEFLFNPATEVSLPAKPVRARACNSPMPAWASGAPLR